MSTSVCVVGASGFIGSAIVAELEKQKKHTVYTQQIERLTALCFLILLHSCPARTEARGSRPKRCCHQQTLPHAQSPPEEQTTSSANTCVRASDLFAVSVSMGARVCAQKTPQKQKHVSHFCMAVADGAIA